MVTLTIGHIYEHPKWFCAKSGRDSVRNLTIPGNYCAIHDSNVSRSVSSPLKVVSDKGDAQTAERCSG